jgi:hypothetical protein
MRTGAVAAGNDEFEAQEFGVPLALYAKQSRSALKWCASETGGS